MARIANTFKPKQASASSTSKADAELIRKKAYEIWEKRGRKPGNCLNDWLEAERVVMGKR